MRAGINVESSESLRIGGGPRSHKVHLGHMLVNTCYVPDDRGLRWLPGLGKPDALLLFSPCWPGSSFRVAIERSSGV